MRLSFNKKVKLLGASSGIEPLYCLLMGYQDNTYHSDAVCKEIRKHLHDVIAVAEAIVKVVFTFTGFLHKVLFHLFHSPVSS